MYLAQNYKQEPKGGSSKPKVPASERVESELGPEYVERFRKQVLDEMKLSPEEKAKLRPCTWILWLRPSTNRFLF
jgi:hypothetical protein